jgi:hypothetical protein
MAMIKCSECEKDISDKSVACVNCGAPVVPQTPQATTPNYDYSQQQYQQPYQQQYQQPTQYQQPYQYTPKPPKKKSKAWIFIVGGVVLFIILIAIAASGGNNGGRSQVSVSPTPLPVTGGAVTPIPETVPEVTATTPSEEPQQAPTTSSVSYEFVSIQERLREGSRNRIYWEIIIEIENTGTVPMASRGSGLIRYELNDSNGRFIDNGSLLMSPQILYPGERGYMFKSQEVYGIDLDTVIILDANWDFIASDVDRINLDVSEIEIRDGLLGDTFYGKITNNTGRDITRRISIDILFYDNNDTFLGAWYSSVTDDIADGQSLGFTVGSAGSFYGSSFVKVTEDMIAYYIIYAYVF